MQTKPIPTADNDSRRHSTVIIALTLIVALLFAACLLIGSVPVSPREVWGALTGSPDVSETVKVITNFSRLPSAATALLAGAALAIAGLQMQTTFDNPLAGPSILGVSTGASLGVAITLLGFGGALASAGLAVASIIGAMVGAMVIILILLAFSKMVKSTAMLLIVGIITGYLTSSVISLLNFFSTQEGVHSFVIWGLGSFSGMTPDKLAVFAPVCIILIFISFLLIKPLDALQLGDAYAANLGVNVKQARGAFLVVSGMLTAIVTAYCGPIAFIGLVVPHIARLSVRTASHLPLLAATALCGSGVTLFCQLISVLPTNGVLPINAITPIIGAPVILYIIVNRRKIFYLR